MCIDMMQWYSYLKMYNTLVSKVVNNLNLDLGSIPWLARKIVVPFKTQARVRKRVCLKC